MNTPLKEAIEILILQQKHYVSLKKNPELSKEVDAILTATTLLRIKYEKLLPKEKKVIEEAYRDGFENCKDKSFFVQQPKDYFNEFYKQ